MSQLRVQNFYSTTATSDIITLWDTSFTVAVAPTYTSGFLVISPNNSALREIVYFHTVVGTTISVRAENRWLGGTTAKLHTSTETVAINDVAEIFNMFSDSLSQCFFIEKTGGLTVKAWGGTVFYNWNPVTVADTSLTLADNQTNYIKYSYPTNTISVDTVNSGNIKARAIVASGVITSITYYVAKESYIDFTVAITGALPSQAGNAWKFLQTDGTNVSWAFDNALRTGLTASGIITTDVTGAEQVTTNAGLVTIGMISPYAGAAAPTGYLICDGAAVSRTTYAWLFAIVSTIYGNGDGSTTFNIPNLKNRAPIGIDTTVKVTVDNCDAAWTAGSNVTASLDASDKKEGTNSVKLAVAAGAGSSQILGYRAISSMSFAGKTTIGFWVKSDIAIAANDLQLRLDDTAALASPLESLNIPALVANQWTKVYLTLATPSADTAIISVWLYQVVDKGAFNIWIDDIATGENYELGATGGEKSHTTTVAEMPSHAHDILNGYVGGGGSSCIANQSGINAPYMTSWSISSQGWSQPISNMSPYLALNYIIKT